MIFVYLSVPTDFTDSTVRAGLSRLYPITEEEAASYTLLHRELVGDKNTGFSYKLRVALSLSEEREAGLLKMRKKVFCAPDLSLRIDSIRPALRPVIVGFGPAGIFAALTLAEAGARPIVLERGARVEERITSVNRFLKDGTLDEECNIQFGEGGAGTFSDGKLKTGSMDGVKYKILSVFAECGAPQDILLSDAPHVGTDLLPGIIAKIRHRIEALGGTVIFGAKLTDVTVSDGRVTSVRVSEQGRERQIPADTVFLGTGHSARDVFALLSRLGVPLEARPFGIGVRIEHPREYIDALRYGDYAASLGAASYHLVTHLPDGRSVYSFCMCPGGSVVAAASEEGSVVTNGMSPFGRDGENSNAALLVSLTSEDFGGAGPLGGVALQERIERRAYAVGGGGFCAPAQLLGDFLCRRPTSHGGSVRPTYGRGVAFGQVSDALPDTVCDALRAGIAAFDEWMPGYALPDAVLTAPETRSTSPVRVLRDASRQSPALRGLYPIGEGAGYAGGIVSSAADGIHSALHYIEIRKGKEI